MTVACDHQRFGIDLPLRIVERLEYEGLLKTLYADRAHHAGIERVRRLTELQHDVVGEVGKQRDRAHAAVIETDLHVDRADRLFDVIGADRGIAVTQLRIDKAERDRLERVVRRKVLKLQRL